MNNIVRAWKDAAYRQSLSAEEQAIVPANPAGEIELTDAELQAIYGASCSGDQTHQVSQVVDQHPTVNIVGPGYEVPDSKQNSNTGQCSAHSEQYCSIE